MRPIVIGSGMGGLATALILKKNGFDPLIFEKEKFWGGSFTSYKVGNYTVDTGMHFLTRGTTGELPKLMKKYIDGDVFEKNFVEQNKYMFYLGDKSDIVPANLSELLKFKILPFRDRLKFIKLVLYFLRMGRENTKTDLTSYEHVKKYIRSDKTLYFLNALSWMSNGCSMKEGSLSRFLDTFIKERRLSVGFVMKHLTSKRRAKEEEWYPIGGLITVPRLFLNEGLKVETGKKVEKIIVADGMVRGVEVGGKFYKSDIVIYDGLVKNLYNIIEGGKLEIKEPKYEEYQALTLWLGFDKKIADWNRVSKLKVMENMGSPHWGFFVTDFDPKLAPPGHQLFGISGILHKEKNLMVKEMKETVEYFIPDYEKHVDMEHVQVCRAEKTLHKNGNNIFYLPEQKTNIKGLYVVGTDTKGWGSGGTLCADTAFRCWEYIKNDINLTNLNNSD
ncbi:MAG: NAD(P)/FAD-dependent oxidoreductase [Candidatus Aenigmarchaeota archaeon]|nr:NAD(P)/FAD-dependent oxidoreductase [Candidatus Aenigmarchaeota archaeon]